ncbi:MAG: class I SAM-dependent methyltransferase [Oscillospiraceae bacterium]|nr:class I SAM-dependent methyltransferase [Oscillospiraceae bacterium]
MSDMELMKKWKEEETGFSLKGWDFSQIDGRWECPNPPWDYKTLIKAYLRDGDILLDMGTGGGEFLLTINHPYKNTYATEAYPPNFELCKRELSPLGITVARTFSDDRLPFDNDSFDFITNRHESFDLSEVDRTLKHGGYFFTQQVGGKNSYELRLALNDGVIMSGPDHELESYANRLARMGFQILIKDEAKYTVKFFDMGAVIFYAKACVWEIPDFSVETHFDRLCKLQNEIDKNGFVQVTGHRFILAARKL